jgi:hypothetical protein
VSPGLDHVVHAVRDLDAAADTYRRLGFTVGARNRHPWGTHNRIVQLAGSFIELLALGEAGSFHSSDPKIFPFAEFNREFLAGGEGLSMLALASSDAAQDAGRFRGASIGPYDLFRFARTGKRPDGSDVQLGFSLAFARDPRAPQAGFFVCQHHHPENFWDPAFQQHANTATAMLGVILVAEHPGDHQTFLTAFAGERNLTVTSAGIAVATSRDRIQIMDPSAFRNEFGADLPSLREGARIAAMRIRVRDTARMRSELAESGAAVSEHRGRIIVGPAAAHGATLVFESASD